MVIRERIINIGLQRDMVGLLTLPIERTSLSPVIIPNAGIVHRVGPHRLHVKLARHLAKQGYPVLRFDLHGLGDSAPAETGKSLEAQAVQDIRAAIDAVKASEVILIGLCSGADNSMRAVPSDDRIRKLVLLDPHVYETALAKTEITARKLMSPGKLIGKIRKLFSQHLPDKSYEVTAVAQRHPITKEMFLEQLSTILDRGGDVLIRYTDFVKDTVSRSEHFFAAFPELRNSEKLQVDVDPRADHTYTTLFSQMRLLSRISEWLNQTGHDGGRD